MKRTFTQFAAMLLLFAAPAAAQEFWDKKPYTEWNKEQCRKILQDSPWASHSGAVDVQNVAFSTTSTEGQDSEKKISYYAQIRSALPVRQAVIRRAMIDNKYEKMSAEQKKTFDDSAVQYLSRVYSDVIIVVEYSSNIEVFDRELARHWQSAVPAEIIQNIYLTAREGVRIQPTRFQADPGAGRAFQLAFPREVNGEPIVNAETKVLRLEMPAPTFERSAEERSAGLGSKGGAVNPNTTSGSRGLKESRAFFEFKVPKMKVKGALNF